MKFTDLLIHHNIPFRESGHEHCRQGWVQLDCPWCHKQDHFRMGYNLAHGYLNCWSCGPKRLADTLAELTRLPVRQVLHLLKDVEKSNYVQDVTRVRGSYKPPSGVDVLQVAHRKYLRGRGFNPDRLSKLWGIRGIGVAPKLQWRLFIPIFQHGKAVSWTTRSIMDRHERRYMTASPEEEAVNHKTLLFGADYVRHAAIIVEGPFDVFRIGPGAVCTFGTSYTRAQINQIAKYPIRVICMDNEPAAQHKAAELCAAVECFPGETYNVTLTGKDAADTSAEEISILRATFFGDSQ